jgi:hypothetical protein
MNGVASGKTAKGDKTGKGDMNGVNAMPKSWFSVDIKIGVSYNSKRLMLI